jgi:formate dehydrogenase maturation protein FdhE
VSTVVESRLRSRIARLAEADPALADALAVRGTVIEIVDRAELDPGELRLPADLVRARLASGVPLVDRLDVPLPAAVAPLVDRLAVAMLADAAVHQSAESLLEALRGHRVHAAQLVGEAVVGHQEHISALADAAGLSAGLVESVADLAARALLEAVAQRLRPALALTAWERSYCPICGGRPVFGEAAGDQGLDLRCGRCATAWAWDGRRCPDCQTGRLSEAAPDAQPLRGANISRADVLPPSTGEDEPPSTHSFSPPPRTGEGLGVGAAQDANAPGLGAGASLMFCDACTSYLKVAPAPCDERLADLLLDDLETWHLDRAALQHGRVRPVSSGYRLEHGEPPGEGLDDD